MGKFYTTIQLEIKDRVATVWLNKPEVRNALSLLMLDELRHVFEALADDKDCDLLLLRGQGPAFCSGADLHWMKESGEAGFKQNYRESLKIAKCLNAIYRTPQPVVAYAHGGVLGGGIGLLCAADIVVAGNTAMFAFTETRLGLAPSTIMPYVLRRLSVARAKYLTFSANQFTAQQALEWGLADELTETDDPNSLVDSLVADILKGTPQSVRESKRLINRLAYANIDKKIMTETARSISELKSTTESRARIDDFLERKKK